MQQPNIFSYSYSLPEKDKKPKLERKTTTRKKHFNYIDSKYINLTAPHRNKETDKDIVF